ncbi:hypothetical protein LWI29_001744 [Acer saccharum]|uniref:Uncharacterized protein n=1 Tax=Acer saccharum TaxID=4024 RepID=A0AA39V648_ACESA|nr:hypothetical protein LWI29_001744 [Acer saccharum]
MKWDQESEQAFQSLKKYLASLPLLMKPLSGEELQSYLAVSETATSEAIRYLCELWILGIVFKVRKVVYLYGEGFGKLLDEISPKSVELAGSKPLSQGFIPVVGSRGGFWTFGHEFGPSAPRELSLGMNSQSSHGYGCLGCVKEAAGIKLASMVDHGVWRT